MRMEGMKPATPFLWDLPVEVAEKLFLHLTLSDRKNLRLTCKWLYKFCNSDHFCKDEKIVWCQGTQDLINDVYVQSDLFHIGRSHYNLVIKDKELEKTSILPFFERLGSKIRSLATRNCYCLPGSLETIITLCENLCSLDLNVFLKNSTTSDFFTIEPFSITRPKVTSLKLSLPPTQLYDYFHRMFSIFPNVKQLQIQVYSPMYPEGQDMDQRTAEFASIFDDLMKSGSNLESLELKYPPSQSMISSNFFEALPNLKYLTIYFNCKLLGETEKWYPRSSNLVSVKLYCPKDFRPPEMIRLMTNTGLKCLNIKSENLIFDKESFEKLVASQMDTIKLKVFRRVSGLPSTTPDSPLKVNETVKDLYLTFWVLCPETAVLFPNYFRGLVHLSIQCVTDSILQSIFKTQKHLRSLQLERCEHCSLQGFFGSEYSINNLQQLEHLSIGRVYFNLFKVEEFKCPLSLSRLKYLHIDCLSISDGDDRYNDEQRFPEISTVLFENLTELRALRLKDVAMPSRKILSSLFSKLKHLDYLRYDMMYPEDKPSTDSVTFINVNCGYFTVTAEECEHMHSLGHGFHDNALDRMVLLNTGLGRRFRSPKISTFEIGWMEV